MSRLRGWLFIQKFMYSLTFLRLKNISMPISQNSLLEKPPKYRHHFHISLRGTFNNKIESKATKNFSILPHTFPEKIKIVMMEYLFGFFLNIIESHVLKGFLGKFLFILYTRKDFMEQRIFMTTKSWLKNELCGFFLVVVRKSLKAKHKWMYVDVLLGFEIQIVTGISWNLKESHRC